MRRAGAPAHDADGHLGGLTQGNTAATKVVLAARNEERHVDGLAGRRRSERHRLLVLGVVGHVVHPCNGFDGPCERRVMGDIRDVFSINENATVVT